MNIQIQIRTECSICKGIQTNDFLSFDVYTPPCKECAGDGYKYKWIDYELSVEKGDDIPGLRLHSIPKEKVYACFNCGTEMTVDKNIVYTSDPPQYKAWCANCSRSEYVFT